MAEPTNWPDVAKTLVSTGVPFLGLILLERFRRKAERLRITRENLRDPIKTFVDEQLTLASRAYWDKMDGKAPNLTELLEQNREREAAVGARVQAIGDPELKRLFDALTDAVFDCRRELTERSDDGEDPFKLKKKAEKLGAELLRLLYR